MILHRVVFEAKFGKAADVVEMLRGMDAVVTEEERARIQSRVLTDISGRFDTVILETTHESLAAFEQFRAAVFARQAESGPSPMMDIIESGRNEYYTIEF